VVAVATPATGLPANVLIEGGAGVSDESKQRLGPIIHWLGRSGDPPMYLYRHIMCAFDLMEQCGEIDRECLGGGSAFRADIEAQHGLVGDDVVGGAAIDPCRIDTQRIVLESFQLERQCC